MSVTEILRRGSRRFSSRISRDHDGTPSRPANLPTISGRAPRIVILSASVGSGHVRAAQAVESALSQILPNATIAHVDVLQLTNKPFRRAYGKGYLQAAVRAPHFVGMMYDWLDRPASGRTSASMRLLFERMNFTRLMRFLTSQPWDLAINTHFLAPEIIAWMRRSKRIDLPQATIVTDFDVHGMWINHPCEHYFVASDEARANLATCGVDQARIDVTGIPIDPVFSISKDSRVCREKHGLALDRPVVLQMAGGFGMGSVERIHRCIRDVSMPLQIVVVAAKNAAAKENLRAMGPHAQHRVEILGFTSAMDELLAAADVIVSKPGGLTTSEALARRCPMVIVEPIPGQEDRNSDFLLENGCAIKANNLAGLTHKLQSLLGDSERLQQLRKNCLHAARPRAAFDVAVKCVELLRRRSYVG